MSSIISYILGRLIILPGIIIGLSFHEFAHAKASSVLGDPTPRLQGRVSLNPVSHIDPVGFLLLLLIGFGWGRPVQIDPRYYKHRRRDELIVSLAGVTMNLLIAVLTAGIMRLAYEAGSPFLFGTSAGGILWSVLQSAVSINLVLMFFNLIPLPPLDGFGIITQIFRLDRKPWYGRFYQLGPMFLMIIILFHLTSYVISPAGSWTYSLIMSIFF